MSVRAGRITVFPFLPPCAPFCKIGFQNQYNTSGDEVMKKEIIRAVNAFHENEDGREGRVYGKRIILWRPGSEDHKRDVTSCT